MPKYGCMLETNITRKTIFNKHSFLKIQTQGLIEILIPNPQDGTTHFNIISNTRHALNPSVIVRKLMSSTKNELHQPLLNQYDLNHYYHEK